MGHIKSLHQFSSNYILELNTLILENYEAATKVLKYLATQKKSGGVKTNQDENHQKFHAKKIMK